MVRETKNKKNDLGLICPFQRGIGPIQKMGRRRQGRRVFQALRSETAAVKKNNSAGGLLKALQRKVYRARDIGIGRDFEWSNTEKDRGAEQQAFY